MTKTKDIENQEYEDEFGELNNDDEFISYCQGMMDEYKFTRYGLHEFIYKVIHSAGFFAYLQRVESKTGIYLNHDNDLDSDLMGILGIKMAAEEISKLAIDDDGYSYAVSDENSNEDNRQA